jgi:hypothetical protein
MSDAGKMAGILKTLGDPKARRLGLAGALGGVAGSLLGEIVNLFPWKWTLGISIIKLGVWFGIIGAVICIGILIGQQLYFKKQSLVGPAIKLGAPFGFLAGAVAGATAQFLFRVIGPTEVLRVVCWGIAGGMLGYVLSFRIPNLGRKNGLIGGITGGLLGGILFLIFVQLMGNVTGRLSGNAAIGFCIGLMLTVMESLSRKMWLEVIYGPREVVTVNLGKEAVRFGSDAQACTIYVRDVPPVALEFTMEQERVLCRYVATQEISYLRAGDRKQLGNVEIVVCSTDAPQPAAPTFTPSTWWKEDN